MSTIVRGVPHLRLLQTSPDAPPLDIYVDERLVAQDVEFGHMTPYVALAAGDHHLGLVPSTEGGEGSEFFHADLEGLQANEDYTLAIAGRAQHLHAMLLGDRTPPPTPGHAKARLLHASPDTPPIDVTFADGAYLFRHVAYRHVTPFVEVAAGTGDAEVWVSDEPDIVAALPNLELAEGSVYTLVALGLSSDRPGLTIAVFMESIPVGA